MLRIDYTDHASARLKERRISTREVEEALRHGVKSDRGSGLRKSVYANQKGTLVVIYKIKSPDEVVIITAYRES